MADLIGVSTFRIGKLRRVSWPLIFPSQETKSYQPVRNRK
jgi:hypothetical protein